MANAPPTTVSIYTFFHNTLLSLHGDTTAKRSRRAAAISLRQTKTEESWLQQNQYSYSLFPPVQICKVYYSLPLLQPSPCHALISTYDMLSGKLFRPPQQQLPGKQKR